MKISSRQPLSSLLAMGVSLVLGGSVAMAGSWNTIPQPLVGGAPGDRVIVKADEGSGLVIDPAWRNVWQVQYGRLLSWYWNGKYFQRTYPSGDTTVAAGTPLVMDEAFHQVFFVNKASQLSVCYRTKTDWVVDQITSETVTTVLGVDQGWHVVYAYDAGRRSITAVHWDAKAKEWKSSLVAGNLGKVTNAAAIDGGWHVLYSVHEDAPDLGVVADDNPFVRPWALVATWWDGKQYQSKVVDQTGLPQAPALRSTDHRVYYSRSSDVNQTRWYQPPQNPALPQKPQSPPPKNPPVTSGVEVNWQGADTYVDDSRYTVNLNSINYYGNSASTFLSDFNGRKDTGWFDGAYHPKPPFRAVDAQSPVWEAISIPERMVEITAVASVSRGELVQQRASQKAATGYRATGWSPVDHVYADARGVYFRLGAGAASVLSYGPENAIASMPTTVTVNGQTFYDPLSVPSSAGSLAMWSVEPTSGPVITGAHFTIPKTMAGTLQDVIADAVEGANSPLPAPRLVVSGAKLTTFGHPMSEHNKPPQAGGRYQTYQGADYQGAMAGGVASDPKSKMILYTQAPPQDAGSTYFPNQVWVVVIY